MVIEETKSDGKVYRIAIFRNEAGKYQYVNLTKEKICPCEFATYREAFADLADYVSDGRIVSLKFDVGGKAESNKSFCLPEGRLRKEIEQ